MDTNADRPKLYGELAGWFHLLTSPKEYGVEADFYSRVLTEAAEIPVSTVLELGSGGGNNAWHMKARFDLTLTDLSSEMLALSKMLNPDVEHVEGDMRTLRLGRQFDAVFVHDAVDYMTTEDDLRAAITTAFEHCKPGGATLLAPDHVRESFQATTQHGGHDGENRGLRYLEWDWDPDPEDNTYLVDFAYLLRDETGQVRVVHDRHICGLFPRSTWLQLMSEAGFQTEIRSGLEDETAPEIFIGVRPR